MPNVPRMPKKHFYYEITDMEIKEDRFILKANRSKSKNHPAEKFCEVIRTAPGMWKAKRLYGKKLEKVFTKRGLLCNDGYLMHEALRWGTSSHTMSGCRGERQVEIRQILWGEN